jgi:serine/threonine protein kinase
MIDETILHYKILEKLGEGGMGVVYKAHDIKLDRFVALKFLSFRTTATEEEKKRFVQEAKAASALNHPNICTIYAIEEENERQFISMEYIDGITLSKKIAESPLKINDAIAYATQIGEALQEAHANGIVHRDIKTENIMVNSKNQTKVMDFGLAKLKGSLKLTKTSNTVGTLAYMAPEQIQGGEPDARSDIFSFGVVLFEMLTGILPFRGEHDASMMYSIVNEEPEPLQKYLPDASSDLIHIINRALEKDPEERYQSIKEMTIDLKRIKKHSTKDLLVSSTTRQTMRREIITEQKEKWRKKKKIWFGIGAFGVLVILAALSYFLFMNNSVPQLPPIKTIGLISYPGLEEMPAFSPDGNSIAFAWNGANQNNFDIYVKLIGAGTSLRLTHDSTNDYYPAWSPDGSYIAFLQVKQNSYSYYIIPSLGGEERKVADVKYAGYGIDWSPDGRELVVSAIDSSTQLPGIMLISIDAGKKQALTSPDMNGLYGDSYPKFSPDGSKIAFLRNLSYSITELYTISSNGGDEKRLTFDKLQVGSEAWTQDGKEIVFTSNRSGNTTLWRIPFGGGSPTSVAGSGDNIGNITIAKKGYSLAYSRGGESANIWRLNLGKPSSETNVPTELISSSEGFQTEVEYSPDGKYIVFSSDRSGSHEIWRCNADGSNPMELTFFGGPSAGSAQWSPDGQFITFDSRAKGNGNIYVINSNGGTPRLLTSGKSENNIPRWSRDGKWIYFSSNRTGIYQIWKIPAIGGQAIQVTRNEGLAAFESYDGQYLYYAQKSIDTEILKVPVAGGAGQPVDKNLNNIYLWGAWTLTKDGIYYIQPDSREGYDALKKGSIYFYSFGSKDIRLVANIVKPIWMASEAISVSPDGRYLIYTQLDQDYSNIMLIQNFR